MLYPFLYESKIQKLITEAQEDNRILAVIIFGSSLKSKYYRDIDLCLFAYPMENKSDYSDIFLDYQDKYTEPFDISVFQTLPLYIKSNVLKEGQILLDKDYDQLFELYLDTIKDYDLFEPHYRSFLEAVKDE